MRKKHTHFVGVFGEMFGRDFEQMTSLPELAASVRAETLINEPMSRHTTFHIGGPAEYFITPADTEGISKIWSYCRMNGMPVTVIGNGSNLLVSDKGIRGVVLSTAELTGMERRGNEIVCCAGAPLADVCRYAEENGLSGLEFAYGIPGTAGGAVYMNAGAYGGEMKDVVTASRHFGEGGAGEYKGGQLAFGYRKSAYSGTGMVITDVTFTLRPGRREEISNRMSELMERRRNRQPLEFPSAGSVFKRPEGYYAGTLIDQCGLKGRSVGGAQVSPKHAGFIVNTGSATCADVLGLIEEVKAEVLRLKGVVLECEIRIIE